MGMAGALQTGVMVQGQWTIGSRLGGPLRQHMGVWSRLVAESRASVRGRVWVVIGTSEKERV